MIILNKIIPIIFIFILGYILKKIRFLKKEDGDLFLKVVFYISLPALIIISISGSRLNFQFAYLPLIATVIIFTTFGLSLLIGRLLSLSRPVMGTFLIGAMIMNTSFNLPFVLAAYGEQGIAVLSMFDLGNIIIVLSFVYYIACRYSESRCSSKIVLQKFLLFPPIWGLLIGILLSLAQMQLPQFIAGFLDLMGGLTVPLIMLTLGIYFELKISHPKTLLIGLLLRFGLGFALAFLAIKLFKLNGLSEKIVLLEGLAPAGYNTLIFSVQEKLDVNFAAEFVSVSILIGLVLIPVVLFILG